MARDFVTELPSIAEAPADLRPTGGYLSRGLAELKRLSDAASQGEWWEDTYPEYDEDGGPTIDRIEGVGAMERGEPESIVQCSERNARFIVAVVNAYRSGQLVPAFAATSSTGGSHVIERFSTEVVACGLADVAGWLENDGRYKHARAVRLGAERLQELDAAQGIEVRRTETQGGSACESPSASGGALNSSPAALSDAEGERP